MLKDVVVNTIMHISAALFRAGYAVTLNEMSELFVDWGDPPCRLPEPDNVRRPFVIWRSVDPMEVLVRIIHTYLRANAVEGRSTEDCAARLLGLEGAVGDTFVVTGEV